ncbi:MAG: outer membrane beta-barrel protein [Alphaproteobacteria bacterium]|nr:outer membrane beta-barrel protein [Alphaproteobacteria bacterium]
MKKLIITSTAVMAMFTGASHADGFYISPRIAWSDMHIDETRIEKKPVNGAWSDFAGAKHESWSDNDGNLAPKFAVGYDYNTNKYGILGLEIEYGQTSNHFDPTRSDVDFDGNLLNDSDSRDFKYSESTLSLNATYGYDFKYVIGFVTAGIGYTTIDSENNFRSGTYWWETRDSERNASWNIGAGIAVPVTKNVSVTLAYRYTDLGNVKYTNRMYHENARAGNNGIERHFDSDVDLSKHEIIAGMKVAF